MKDNFIDLVVTSPPYDDLRDYKNDSYIFPFEKIAKELFRVLKKGGVIVWVVGDRIINGSQTGTSFKQALYFKKIGFNLHQTIIYEKNNFRNVNSNRYCQTHEYMFVLSKGKPKCANLLRDRRNKSAGQKIHGTQRMKDGRIIPKSGIGKVIPEYGLRGNVWSYNTGKNHSTKDQIAFLHPAIMPEPLVQDHIVTWSKKRDIVYDCFGGSGTTAKMAKLNGRHYIISEVVKEYIPIIEERLKAS